MTPRASRQFQGRNMSRMVGVPKGAQLLVNRLFRRIVRALEEALEILLRVAGNGDFLQPGGAGIHEYEDIPAAGVNPRRRHNGFCERIIVKLFVHHDPHIHVIAPHHVEKHCVPLYQPSFAHRDLLRPRQ